MRKLLAEHYGEELLFLHEEMYDKAIIGVAHRACQNPVVAYDREKVVKISTENSVMTPEEAEEYFEYNQLGAYVGDYTPVFIDRIEGMDL